MMCSALPSGATESVSFDGVWWQQLLSPEKTVAVQGMLVGRDSGYLDGYSAGAGRLFDDPFYKLGLQRSSLADKKRAEKQYEKIGSYPTDKVGDDITFGTIVDKIDAVYRDNPDLVKNAVFQFVACAGTKGMDCQKTIDELRKRNAAR